MPPRRHRRSPRLAVIARAIERSIRRSLDRSGALLLLAAAGAMLAVILLVLAAAPARAAASRALIGDYAVGSARRVELGFPFGEVRVTGTNGSRVRVRVEASCRDEAGCADFLKELKLEGVIRGGTLRVKLDAPSLRSLSDPDDESEHRHRQGRHGGAGRDGDEEGFTITVEVPRSLEVELKVGAGDLEVSDLSQDLTINLGAGEVNVRMPAKHVGNVDVNMAIGQTTIRQGGKTREYERVLGGPIRWREGQGDAGIEVNVGAGDVDVTLE